MTDTRVELRRNDGSEVFKLKTSRVETEISNGLVTDSVVSGVSRKVLGGKLVLDLRTFQIDIDIQGMDSADFPNAGTYDDVDYGYRWELERAALEWGWDSSNGFDQLYYDGRTFNAVITNLAVTEDTTAGKARTYTGTLEITYLDTWIA